MKCTGYILLSATVFYNAAQLADENAQLTRNSARSQARTHAHMKPDPSVGVCKHQQATTTQTVILTPIHVKAPPGSVLFVLQLCVTLHIHCPGMSTLI